MAMSQITLREHSYVPSQAFEQLHSNQISFPSEPRCIPYEILAVTAHYATKRCTQIARHPHLPILREPTSVAPRDG